MGRLRRAIGAIKFLSPVGRLLDTINAYKKRAMWIIIAATIVTS